MATLKLSKKVKGKIRGKSQQFQGETFGLGAGQENEIQIESDLVSEQHAQIQFENGKFYLLDLKSLLGTYKNGALVQDKIELQTNDKISIADRLFSVEINQEKELIHLIQESSHKKEKTPPELEELPEDKRWNKALLAICVLFGILTPALVLPAILPAEDIWSTGPLHFKHLVNGKPIDCSACHSQSFGKVPDQACAKCHKQESIRDVHHTQTKQQPLPCTQCHLEHQGRTSLPAFQHTTAENKIVDLTLTTPSLTSCRNCHPKVHKESAKPLVHLEIIEKTKVFKFPGFSHQQHLSEKATQKMKRKILCKDCHPYSPNPFEDFTPTQFETCLQCHYHKQKHSVPNHGETSCLQCHTSTYSGDWRKLKLTYQTLSSFQMKHSFHLAMGKGKTKKCQECHIAQKTLPTLIQGRRFPHEKHLQITPASKELCLACHYAPPKKIFTLRTPSALKSKHIPFSIRDEFQSNRFPLAPDAVKIKISPQKWLIRSGQKEFTIVQEDQKFQVYLRSLIVRMPNKELCQKCHNSPLTEKHSQMPWHQAEIQLRFTTKQRPATPFPHTPHIAFMLPKSTQQKLQERFSLTSFPQQTFQTVQARNNTKTQAIQKLSQKGCLACHTYHPKTGFQTLPSKQLCVQCHIQPKQKEFYRSPQKNNDFKTYKDHVNLNMKTCKECHNQLSSLFVKGRKLFVQGKYQTKILRRPFIRDFRHKTGKHREPKCLSCHKGLDHTQNLFEVKRPDIQGGDCSRCHLNPPKKYEHKLKQTQEENKFNLENCFQCHTYHIPRR